MSAWFSRLKREYETGNLPAKQYLVLCELGRFDGCRLGIFPSHRTLAARARCGIRTVQRALQAARRLGLVEWTGTRVRAARAGADPAARRPLRFLAGAGSRPGTPGPSLPDPPLPGQPR